jgi:hypothetical protein
MAVKWRIEGIGIVTVNAQRNGFFPKSAWFRHVELLFASSHSLADKS